MASVNALIFMPKIFSVPAGLEVLYREEPGDDFLKFVLLNLFASLIMAMWVSVHFMFIQKYLVEGFDRKKNFSSNSFVETALTIRRIFGISKISKICQFWVVSSRKCTTEHQF